MLVDFLWNVEAFVVQYNSITSSVFQQVSILTHNLEMPCYASIYIDTNLIRKRSKECFTRLCITTVKTAPYD